MIFGHLLLLVLTLYSSSLLAAEYDGTRIANRTIERVRRNSSGRPKNGMLTSLGLQTIQLRTHSLFAPYIDEDLQNRCVSDAGLLMDVASTGSHRWWDFGADAYVVRHCHYLFRETR